MVKNKYNKNLDQYKYWNNKTVYPWIKYDLHMNQKFENITNILFSDIKIKKGEQICDIGCGSGFTCFIPSKKVGNKGNIIGIDISKPLLNLFNNKYKKIKNITSINTDIELVKLKENAFDHIYSRFGVMFFNNPVIAFKNMHSSLKKGGDLTFVCWTNFKNNQFHSIPVKALKEITNFKIPKITNTPGPFAFHEKKYIIKILKKSNFKNFKIKNIKTTLKTNTIDVDNQIMMQIGTAARVLRSNKASKIIFANVKNIILKKIKKEIFNNQLQYKANIFLVKAIK